MYGWDIGLTYMKRLPFMDGLARTGRVFLFYFDNDLPSKKLKEDSISHVLALFIA
jgi:hypothetical protein